MADTTDLKSVARNGVPVRVRLRLPIFMIRIITMPFRLVLTAVALILFSPVLLFALVIDPSILGEEIWKDLWNFILNGSNREYWD